MIDKEEAEIIQNLKDAGCDEDTVSCFMECLRQGKISQEKALLAKHRKELLECVHQHQKKIDCLDYLLYKMKEKE